MAGLSVRRDLVLMGTFAAIAGIGLAAALTAALGVRSSGPPAPLKAAAAPAVTATIAEAPVASKTKIVHRRAHKPRHRRHRRHIRQAAPAPPPQVVAQAPVRTRVQAPVQQPQPVSAPAPAPAPRPQPLSRPKPKPTGGGSGGGTPGVSFDDSG